MTLLYVAETRKENGGRYPPKTPCALLAGLLMLPFAKGLLLHLHIAVDQAKQLACGMEWVLMHLSLTNLLTLLISWTV